MIAGITGETLAIIALSNQTAAPPVNGFVLITMILLTVAAGAGPYLGVAVARQQLADLTDSAALSEPDKTDPA